MKKMKQSGYHTQTPSDYTRKLNPNFLLSNEYRSFLFISLNNNKLLHLANSPVDNNNFIFHYQHNFKKCRNNIIWFINIFP